MFEEIKTFDNFHGSLEGGKHIHSSLVKEVISLMISETILQLLQ